TPAGPTRRPRAVRLRLWHSCTLPFSRTGQGGTGVGWDGADGTAGTAGVGGEAEAVRLIFAATALWWPKMLRQCAKNYNPMGYLTRGVVYRPGDDGRRGVRVAADGVPVMRASLISPLNAGGRVEEVVERISRAILLGLVVDGEQLPTEVEFAHQLGVSPMTLREALAVLRQRGLVETRRGRDGGTFVRRPAHPPLGALEEQLRTTTVSELRDLADEQFAVCGAAALLAAERASAANVRRM